MRRYCGRRSEAEPQDEVRLRLKELAQARVRYGYRRLHVLLRREGWTVTEATVLWIRERKRPKPMLTTT